MLKSSPGLVAHKPPRPLAFPLSLLFFLVPAGIIVLCAYFVGPWLQSLGLPAYYASALSVYVPLGLLIPAAVIGFKAEKRVKRFREFRERFRFRQLRRADWLWTLFVLAVMFAGFFVGRFLEPLIRANLPMPAVLPAVMLSVTRADLGGGGLWLFILSGAFFLALNVLGEEYWWRGYILPRQEAAHGKHAWWIHGLLWTLFHLFKFWIMPSLLPGALTLSFVAWKRRNTYPALIAHALFNAVSFALMVAAVVNS